jgi:hypothetical protein
MESVLLTTQSVQLSSVASIQIRIATDVEHIAQLLPDPGKMSPEQRRGIIARYSAVLEGNFIYWMTGAYLSVKTDMSRTILGHNLWEEVRDCHPGMLRRFAIAANAFPKDSDALAISEDLMRVRMFVGRLSTTPMVVMMAFFESFIQRFMVYLANLATLQGSDEHEYTDVHGLCDIEHTQELFRAVSAEIWLDGPRSEDELFEGVKLLTALIHCIIGTSTASTTAA